MKLESFFLYTILVGLVIELFSTLVLHIPKELRLVTSGDLLIYIGLFFYFVEKSKEIGFIKEKGSEGTT